MMTNNSDSNRRSPSIGLWLVLLSLAIVLLPIASTQSFASSSSSSSTGLPYHYYYHQQQQQHSHQPNSNNRQFLRRLLFGSTAATATTNDNKQAANSITFDPIKRAQTNDFVSSPLPTTAAAVLTHSHYHPLINAFPSAAPTTATDATIHGNQIIEPKFDSTIDQSNYTLFADYFAPQYYQPQQQQQQQIQQQQFQQFQQLQLQQQQQQNPSYNFPTIDSNVGYGNFAQSIPSSSSSSSSPTPSSISSSLSSFIDQYALLQAAAAAASAAADMNHSDENAETTKRTTKGSNNNSNFNNFNNQPNKPSLGRRFGELMSSSAERASRAFKTFSQFKLFNDIKPSRLLGLSSDSQSQSQSQPQPHQLVTELKVSNGSTSYGPIVSPAWHYYPTNVWPTAAAAAAASAYYQQPIFLRTQEFGTNSVPSPATPIVNSIGGLINPSSVAPMASGTFSFAAPKPDYFSTSGDAYYSGSNSGQPWNSPIKTQPAKATLVSASPQPVPLINSSPPPTQPLSSNTIIPSASPSTAAAFHQSSETNLLNSLNGAPGDLFTASQTHYGQRVKPPKDFDFENSNEDDSNNMSAEQDDSKMADGGGGSGGDGNGNHGNGRDRNFDHDHHHRNRHRHNHHDDGDMSLQEGSSSNGNRNNNNNNNINNHNHPWSDSGTRGPFDEYNESPNNGIDSDSYSGEYNNNNNNNNNVNRERAINNQHRYSNNRRMPSSVSSPYRAKSQPFSNRPYFGANPGIRRPTTLPFTLDFDADSDSWYNTFFGSNVKPMSRSPTSYAFGNFPPMMNNYAATHQNTLHTPLSNGVFHSPTPSATNTLTSASFLAPPQFMNNVNTLRPPQSVNYFPFLPSQSPSSSSQPAPSPSSSITSIAAARPQTFATPWSTSFGAMYPTNMANSFFANSAAYNHRPVMMMMNPMMMSESTVRPYTSVPYFASSGAYYMPRTTFSRAPQQPIYGAFNAFPQTITAPYTTTNANNLIGSSGGSSSSGNSINLATPFTGSINRGYPIAATQHIPSYSMMPSASSLYPTRLPPFIPTATTTTTLPYNHFANGFTFPPISRSSPTILRHPFGSAAARRMINITKRAEIHDRIDSPIAIDNNGNKNIENKFSPQITTTTTNTDNRNNKNINNNKIETAAAVEAVKASDRSDSEIAPNIAPNTIIPNREEQNLATLYNAYNVMQKRVESENLETETESPPPPQPYYQYYIGRDLSSKSKSSDSDLAPAINTSSETSTSATITTVTTSEPFDYYYNHKYHHRNHTSGRSIKARNVDISLLNDAAPKHVHETKLRQEQLRQFLYQTSTTTTTTPLSVMSLRNSSNENNVNNFSNNIIDVNGDDSSSSSTSSSSTARPIVMPTRQAKSANQQHVPMSTFASSSDWRPIIRADDTTVGVGSVRKRH